MCWIMNWKWLLIIHAPSLSRCNLRAAGNSFFFINQKTFKGTYEIFSVIISKIKTPKKLHSHRSSVNLLMLWMKEAIEILNIYPSCAKWPLNFPSQLQRCSSTFTAVFGSLCKDLGVIPSFLWWSRTYFLFPYLAFRQGKSQPNETSMKYDGAVTLTLQSYTVPSTK